MSAWIKACNRPHHQLNINIVEKNYELYICSKHFVDGAPSARYPDPISASSLPTIEDTSGNVEPKASQPPPHDRSISKPHKKRQKVLTDTEHENRGWQVSDKENADGVSPVIRWVAGKSPMELLTSAAQQEELQNSTGLEVLASAAHKCLQQDELQNSTGLEVLASAAHKCLQQDELQNSTGLDVLASAAHKCLQQEELQNSTGLDMLASAAHKCLQQDEQQNTTGLDMLASAAHECFHQEELQTATGLNMLGLAAENHRQHQELCLVKEKLNQTERAFAKQVLGNEDLRRELKSQAPTHTGWNVERLKTHMKYYTGFDAKHFKLIFNVLAPNGEVPFTQKRNDVKQLPLEDHFLLVMIKLRQNFDFSHLAHCFSITKQGAGEVFQSWINHMFFKFGEVPTWPHRDILIQKMPEKFRKDFPVTLAILDGTEIRTESPSALKSQSQFYSDYKSSTILKGLVAVDPRGSFIFISMLFTGSISDKEICVKSGLVKQLKLLMESGKILHGDGIMVDKGFHIAGEIKELGLKLWIPPFASSDVQMSAEEISQTRKIAKHRIVVENAICRAKKFKIIKDKLSLNLFPTINQIWFCCWFLTHFMPCLVKSK